MQAITEEVERRDLPKHKAHQTLIQHIRITPTELYSLKQQCRVERTTMTTFVQRLLCKVILHCVKDAERLMCATAISLRRWIFMDCNINCLSGSFGRWFDH